jgi:tripartite-type tricarboxylate transporter receptor subunit TctC
VVSAFIGAGGVLAAGLPAFAQPYPNHPVRLIVPYAPGGGSDTTSRIMAKPLAELFGQQIVIDNRPGAGTIIGAELAAKSPPDGYTLFSGITGTMAINPSIYAKLPYDPVRDFAPIAMIATGPNVLVVHPSVPAKNVNELIALAKKNPGQLTYASSGTGGAPHLAGELFKYMAGIDMVHVPYKGAAPATLDVLSGNVQVMFGGLAPVVPQVKAGKLRALAVAGAKRSQALPDVPSLAETLKGYDGSTWFAIFAPAGTPNDIINKVSADLATVMSRKDVSDQLLVQGYEPWIMGPKELGPFVSQEIAKWAKVIKAAGIKGE